MSDAACRRHRHRPDQVHEGAATTCRSPGLVREAAQPRARRRRPDWADIDAVVIGKAPDIFEGVMMPELYLADALGAAGKPMLRVHTAGSVGGSTAIVATDLVEAGRYERVLAVACEKQSEGNAQWGLGGGRSGGMGAGGIFAPWIRAYISRSGAPEHIGWQVAVKDRLNAVEEPVRAPAAPRHHHREGARVADAVGPDPLPRVVPVVRRRVRDGPRRPRDGGEDARRPPAWVLATPMRSRARPVPGPRHREPAGRRRLRARRLQAGRHHRTRARRSTSPSSTCRSRWYEPMWLEGHDLADPGEGWKMTDSGATEITGDFPVNPSGGVLSSNPIGASGMIRFAEAALQVRGMAGEHQVEGAKVALGHAYGGAAQYFAMAVLSKSPSPF